MSYTYHDQDQLDLLWSRSGLENDDVRLGKTDVFPRWKWVLQEWLEDME